MMMTTTMKLMKSQHRPPQRHGHGAVLGIHCLTSSCSHAIVPALPVRKPGLRGIKKHDRNQTAWDLNPGPSGSAFCAHLPVGHLLILER